MRFGVLTSQLAPIHQAYLHRQEKVSLSLDSACLLSRSRIPTPGLQDHTLADGVAYDGVTFRQPHSLRRRHAYRQDHSLADGVTFRQP